MPRQRNKRPKVTVALDDSASPQVVKINLGFPEQEKRVIHRMIDREMKALNREFRRAYHVAGNDDEDTDAIAFLLASNDA